MSVNTRRCALASARMERLPVTEEIERNCKRLLNKEISVEDLLSEVESVLVSARNAEWLNAPKQSEFDFEHYKAVHCYLFSDLYDWAGQVRREPGSVPLSILKPRQH